MNTAKLWIKVIWDNGGEIADLLFDLYERWQDECEYEDIGDYLKVIQTKIPEAYEIHEYPFGVTCKCDNGDIRISVKSEGESLKLVAQRV